MTGDDPPPRPLGPRPSRSPGRRELRARRRRRASTLLRMHAAPLQNNTSNGTALLMSHARQEAASSARRVSHAAARSSALLGPTGTDNLRTSVSVHSRSNASRNAAAVVTSLHPSRPSIKVHVVETTHSGSAPWTTRGLLRDDRARASRNARSLDGNKDVVPRCIEDGDDG
jgi:hypothetical protein